ncbi:MAG: OmpA family protein [Deltaproteobacteria bacterium]|nr:OmpA family protein [Deltaproteobacteria bacterium]
MFMKKNILITTTVLFTLLISMVAVAEDSKTEAKADEVASGDLYRPTHDKFNLHLGVGFVYGMGENLKKNQYENMGVQGLVGFDIVLLEPLALSFQGGFNTLVGGPKSESLTSAFVGAGFRLRFLSDTNGALADGGTAAGNMWIDAHFSYVNHVYEDHAAYDIGVGYEFALFKNINMGPYARFMHVAIGSGTRYMAISGGLAISIAGDTTPQDMDRDQIIDELDSCPKEAEDKDGFDDDDGCPDPDNDEDGIDDISDQCPDVAGLAEKQGCPETDNDHDGMINEEDICPDDAEDMDGFEDEDGCPDLDNDKDGVADTEDKCGNEKEDMDGYMDEDGCPDLDNDSDGIADTDDKCPNDAESMNGAEDEDGCPDFVRVDKDQIIFVKPIVFDKGKGSINAESEPIIKELAAMVKAKSGNTFVISAYSSTSTKDKKNMELSAKKGESVKEALVNEGVAAEVLTVEGKGAIPKTGDKEADKNIPADKIEILIVPQK